jgi:hypothetical protein
MLDKNAAPVGGTDRTQGSERALQARLEWLEQARMETLATRSARQAVCQLTY